MFKRKTYADGLLEGQELARATFERTLCVLREELGDVRQARDAEVQRSERCVDLLLQHLGTRAISLAGMAQEEERAARHVRTVGALTQFPDPTDELPYGDPNGLFKNAKEASLFGGVAVATDEDVQ